MIIKEKNYVPVPTSHLYDKDLSLSSKGLLTILFSGICEKDDHFDFEKFRTICKDKKEAEQAFLEIFEAGYVDRCGDNFIICEYPPEKERINIPKICYLKRDETPIQEKESKSRNCAEYAEWRKFVFKRDNYTCQMCGKRGGSLNAHHIKPWAKYPDFRFDKENGITLCEQCHKYVHKKKV